MIYALIAIAVGVILTPLVVIAAAIVFVSRVDYLGERFLVALASPPEPSEDAALLRRDLNVLKRELVDVDEKSEERFKRVVQRFNRQMQREKQSEEPEPEAAEPGWSLPPGYQDGGFGNTIPAIPLRPSPKHRR